MSRYTMRLTRLSNPPDPNDFIFLCDGFDVGRCKLEKARPENSVRRVRAIIRPAGMVNC